MHVFSTSATFSFPVVGSFLALSAAAHGGGPHAHYAQVWAPAELNGARSGRSKSRELASHHGIAYCRVRASQVDAPYLALLIFALLLLLLLIYHVPPSSSQALYFVATTA